MNGIVSRKSMNSLLFIQKAYSGMLKNYVHYPYFLSPEYELLQYDESYSRRLKKFELEKANIHQIDHDRLPKFLSEQIKLDKIQFLKEKEFIFVGRSNVGKSLLLNKIFNNKRVARSAKQAGTTRFLHFHRFKFEGQFYNIVDAPGYGFANMNKRRRHLWFGLTEQYLKISSRLAQIYWCLNLQHGVKEIDKEFGKRIDKFNVAIQPVFCKSDKVNPKNFMAQLKSMNETLRRLQMKNLDSKVLACSAKDGFGMEFLRQRLVESIDRSQLRNIDQKQDLLLSYLKDLRVQPTELNVKQKQLSKQYLVRKLIYQSKLSKYIK